MHWVQEMRRYVILTLVMLTCAATQAQEQVTTTIPGLFGGSKTIRKYDLVCLGGVAYWHNLYNPLTNAATAELAPAYKPLYSHPMTCQEAGIQ